MNPKKRLAHKNAYAADILRADTPKIFRVPDVPSKRTSACPKTDQENVRQSSMLTMPKTPLVQQQQQKEFLAIGAGKHTIKNVKTQKQNLGPKNVYATNILRADTPRIFRVPHLPPNRTSACPNADLEIVPQSSTLALLKTPLVHQQQPKKFLAEAADKRTTKNVKTQKQKLGLKHQRQDTPMEWMEWMVPKTKMLKRRKIAIEFDRVRLKNLLREINNDPPPSWHMASIMWLDVDVLERRIEEFEKEQAAENKPA
ncbi:GH13697 [Drosophila grimshawi]|uniref:GH13697 n=1 Tax=Drosophila grimshawi TaxID=7222 RepID=B4JQH1_DROGR|nr:GH13697 [Drosophila grimshawi]